nr:DUF2326 domain-containing protein [uncultured Chitinophaga sp.]
MKLSQIYANKSFKKIKFNDGLNLVLAKVTQKLDLNKDSHNLGKTTLISIIDFMLLKEIDASHIFVQYKEKFSGYVFFLEITLNSGSYLTIRRSVDTPTKISFKSNKRTTNCLTEEKWDATNIAIGKAQEMLNEYLSFDVLKNWDYRKSVTYFLRTQKDYNDVFQLDKFRIGKHVNWKPFIFDLLGFDGNLLAEKYDLDDEITSQKAFVAKIKTQFAVDTEEVDKIKGAISLKKAEQKEMLTQVDNFNFYQQERSLNKTLVEDIERNISDLNSQEYNLEYDLEKINSSLNNNISFDIEQLKTLYEEANIYFPDNLVKSYKDLEDFNKKITEERNKYLQLRLQQTIEQLKNIRLALLRYDDRRNEILSVLRGKDSFKKFKKYQIDLTRIEGEVSRLEEKLLSIDRISALNEQTELLSQKLEKVIKKINAEIASEDNKIYPEVRRLFNNIFKYILNTPALIYIEANKNGNIEFRVDVTKDSEIDITAEGKGNTYQKILCISFDLAILIAYHRHSFFRFVYHDGAIEGLDNRKKANYIKLVRSACVKYNLQYIFTSIEDDIPVNLLKEFTKKEICLTLSDAGDEGKLFELSF